MIFLTLVIPFHLTAQRGKINFNHGWEFYRLDINTPLKTSKPATATSRNDFSAQFFNEYVYGANEQAEKIIRQEADSAVLFFETEYYQIKDKGWQNVSLPHTAFVEQLNTNINQWEGICYYRKRFSLPVKERGRKIFLDFEGAMQQADVWLNGKLVLQNKGGYLPFEIDLSLLGGLGKSNEIIIRLDNHAGKNFPPGKKLQSNGFNYWSGIYRDVTLVVTDPVHITNATEANQAGGGGIFVRTPKVNKEQAQILIQSHIVNENKQAVVVYVEQSLKTIDNKLVVTNQSVKKNIERGKDWHFKQEFFLNKPNLWNPDNPYLYILETKVYSNGVLKDMVKQKIGIRKLSFTRENGFMVNGESVVVTGTNRHQDYPYIGNALSNDAQYRDMKKIKEAGLNFVRLCHYPQDPSVYEAADELGLMLIDCIPGWQFYNKDSIFRQRVERDIRKMIRRDRNHPSIVLWEVSLNESYPPDEFRNYSHEVAHQELPIGEFFTCGDTYGGKNLKWDLGFNNWYDPKDDILTNTYERAQDIMPDKPGLIREYADFEFGGYQSTTRVTRVDGEKSLLQALWNTQWEHNTNLRNYAPYTIGDATWAMYDNNAGYADKMQEWGISDIFRLPKFQYYFFRSQLSPNKRIAAIGNDNPIVFIANWWTERAPEKVIVLSNCDQIVLSVNGKFLARQQPDSGPTTVYGAFAKGGTAFDGGNCEKLPHPPFTFNKIPFEAGILKAEGYIRGKKVAEHIVHTPQPAVALKIDVDYSGRLLRADNVDAVFVHASLVDKNGTIAVLDNETEVTFSIEGKGRIVGLAVTKARAGIATILLQSASLQPGSIGIKAAVKNITAGFATIKMY